jgi:transcriptional regulator with XRE-family HTH domain
MTTRRVAKAPSATGSRLLGVRLRQARLNRGFSLQDVESLTDGAIKAATLSAYELGDTNIPALRLGTLGELYEVSLDDLLSPIGDGGSLLVSEDPVRAVGALVHIDLPQRGGDGGPAGRVYSPAPECQLGTVLCHA